MVFGKNLEKGANLDRIDNEDTVAGGAAGAETNRGREEVAVS